MRLIVTNEPKSHKIIVKEKVAIFIIATVVLLLNLFLMLDRIFSYLEFVVVIFLVAVCANGAFSLIDRRRKKQQETL
jgi:ABC-type iron transport system FetAB permease component